MPYIPPPGAAVPFDFSGLYVPPPGAAVPFDFVFGTGGGGTGTTASPAAQRVPFELRYPEDDAWTGMARRRFAPADGYGGELQPPRMKPAPLWVKFEEEPQLPWRRRRMFADSSSFYRRKRAAQIIG